MTGDLEFNVPGEWRFWMTALSLRDRAGKAPGKRNGPIGHVGIEVAQELARRCREGRYEGSIVDLADQVGRARSAVEEAIGRLKVEGFIDYLPGVTGRPSIFRPRLPGYGAGRES